MVVFCRTTLASRSKPSHKTHSKAQRRSADSILQSDSEQLKAELERVQKDIADHISGLKM